MIQLKSKELKSRARALRLLLLDVDGVMTDGSIVLSGDEGETKRFNVSDGMGIIAARKAGIKVGFLTGRLSDTVRRRAEELGVDEVLGSSFGKEDILEELNLTMIPEQLEMRELVPATDTEAEVLRYISKDPVHIDAVCRESGLSAAAVSSVLAMMELKGLVREIGSKSYVRAREAREEYAATGGG